MHSLAYDEIESSYVDASNEIRAKSVKSSQWEAKYVAHLCRAMSRVARSWGSELTAAGTGFNLSMATVFTHQSPCVKWMEGTTRRRCELADILLVMIDRRASTPKGNAVLIQAKISTNGSLSLSTSSERTQFDLFSTRPTFDVDTTPAPRRVDLSHFTSDSSLMYGLINMPITGASSWHTANNLRLSVGNYKVDGGSRLAYTLVGMLLGNCGWKFPLPPRGSDWSHFSSTVPRDDWASLINYLLVQTFAKPLSVALRASMGRPSRGQEDVVHLSTSNSVGQPMFFISHKFTDLISIQHFSRENDLDTDNWRIVNPDNKPSFNDGGNMPDRDEPDNADPPSKCGPISAIIFEVGG
jgi:hypothetical protein